MQNKPATFNRENYYATCDALAEKDIVFKSLLREHGYPPFWSRPPGFETLIHIILEQQVSLASALAAFNKLKQLLVNIEPANLLALPDEALKACYFSRQKMVYARHLASCILSGEIVLKGLEATSNESVSKHLQQVKGIGNWTTEVYLMMALQRMDCFPIGDIALVNSMKVTCELPSQSTREELLLRAESWRPYRSIASFLLWHAYLQKKRVKNNFTTKLL